MRACVCVCALGPFINTSHHIVEDEARVGQLEVLEQAVELSAVERAPGTVQVVSGLRLLPAVVVVQELHREDRPSALPVHRQFRGEVR